MKRIFLLVASFLLLSSACHAGWYYAAVDSGADVTAPEFSSATIDGTSLTVNWSEAVTRGTGYNDSDLNLDMSTTGSDIGVTYSSGDGTAQWSFTASSAAVSGETVDLDFNGDTDSIEDGAGNDLAALTSESVTNNTSGLNWSNITFFLNFEANDTTGDYDMQTTSCGTECEFANSGDTSGAYNGSATIAGSDPYELSTVTSTSYMLFDITDGTEISSTAGAILLVFEAASALSNQSFLFRFKGSSLADYYSLDINGADDLRLIIREGASTLVSETSTTAGLTTSTQYVVEFLWDTVADTYAVYLDNSLLISGSATMAGFTAVEFEVGNSNTGTTDVREKMIMVSDTSERLWDFRNETGYGN